MKTLNTIFGLKEEVPLRPTTYDDKIFKTEADHFRNECRKELAKLRKLKANLCYARDFYSSWIYSRRYRVQCKNFNEHWTAYREIMKERRFAIEENNNEQRSAA